MSYDDYIFEFDFHFSQLKEILHITQQLISCFDERWTICDLYVYIERSTFNVERIVYYLLFCIVFGRNFLDINHFDEKKIV